MRRLLIGTAFLAMFGIGAPAARANSNVHWDVPGLGTDGSAVMKNLYVDLIFWGWGQPFIDPVSGQLNIPSDAQSVLDDVQDISTWLNSGWVFDHNGGTPSYLPGHLGQGGWEPTVHSYGVSGVTPGVWINDYTDAIPWWDQAFPVGTGGLDHGDFTPIIDHAQTGALGPALDFQGNFGANQLPIGANRIALVITKGTNTYCITPDNLPSWLADLIPAQTCETATGFHDWRTSQGVTAPYGASFANMDDISHELMEAMTDPITFGGWTGTHSDYGLAEVPDEVADECENVHANGDGGFAWLTVDPPYNMTSFVGGWNTPSTSCLQVIPEQHAPMAAKVEFSGGNAPLVLFFIDTNGHLQKLTWAGAGQPASDPVDLGQPSPDVKAAGKPAIVYSTVVGERIFVRGSDQGLWMYYNNTWYPLYGQIFGDPSAVVWGSGANPLVDVFVLGLDDHIYYYGMTASVLFGYSGLNSSGTAFVGSPTVITRDGNSLDLFAVGEDGGLKWMALRSTGWAPPVTINRDPNHPYVSTPAVVQLNQTTTQLVGTLAAGSGNGWMQAAIYNGASWQGWNWGFQLPPDDSIYGPFPHYGTVQNYGFQGTPAVVGGLDGGHGRADVFAVTRTGELFWYYSIGNVAPWRYGTIPPDHSAGQDDPPLVDRDVTGDPVAISRGTGEVEVLYRKSNGSLTHMTMNNNNGVWTTQPPEIVLANGPFIQ